MDQSTDYTVRVELEQPFTFQVQRIYMKVKNKCFSMLQGQGLSLNNMRKAIVAVHFSS